MTREVSCTNGQETLQLHAAFVTPNTFQFLGVDPLLGRSIIPEDAKPAAPPVFAMNYRLWQKHFNADPKIVGTSFVVGGVPRTLVAVMPPRFQIEAPRAFCARRFALLDRLIPTSETSSRQPEDAVDGRV